MTIETTTKTRRRSKSTGCGCGCGGNKPGGSSNCNCNDQTPPCPNVGILRPYFFAGQLLTEDDLQQITTYQNAKRRLTNRYVFGTGVVCGLEVVASSDPKTPGVITVNPGYALDCCGNDIVLSCPYPIDVNTMIRDQGLDCGDPCEEAKAEEGGQREYLLCVRYSEVPSEPVNPYSPGGTTTCVNTRYAESCTFELQCPPKKCDPRSDLRERIVDLLEEADDALSVDVERWQALCDNRSTVIASTPIALTATDITNLAGASDAITKFSDALPTKVPLTQWTEEAMGKAIEALSAPAQIFARFQYADPTTFTSLPFPTTGTITNVSTLNTAITTVSSALVAAQGHLAAVASPSFSAGIALRSQLLQEEIKKWTDSTTGAIDKLRTRHDVRLFVMNGAPYSFDRYRTALKVLAARFDGSKMPADTEDDFTNDNLDQVCDLARRYSDAETHDIREALCSFVNPPCQPCDNLCVILASICVKQCKVVAVCNLVRTIIISPAALGYWLPLQETLQALCCRKSSREGELGTLENLIKPFQTAGDRFFQRETPTTANVSNTTKVPTQGAEPSGTH
jgi:hypothetical protein